jgi:hypothetical protein
MAAGRAAAWNKRGNIAKSTASTRVDMNSWYLPAFPAAVALSVIAYSFWIAYG